MKTSAKALLTGVGAAAMSVAAVGTATYASTKFFLSVAIDRQQPHMQNMEKAREKLRGYPDMADFAAHMDRCAKQLQNSPHQYVQIKSHDGYTLAGHWFPCENPQRVIVAMHGWRSCWCSDFGTVADFWRKNNCSVLYAEQRGQGGSGGDYISFGVLERYDCVRWANWINRQTDGKLPIYLVGVSMGATSVLMAGGLKLPDNVRGIIADCGFTSPDEIFRHVAHKNLHLPYELHTHAADRIFRKRLHTGTKECSTVDALKMARIPVMLVHGSADHFVPVEMTYQNYQACAAPKRLLIVPGADHGMSYYTEKDRYEKAVLDFFEEFDNGIDPPL